MSEIYRLVPDFLPGAYLPNAAREAIELARSSQYEVTFDFNDTRVDVEKDDTPETLVRRWYNARAKPKE